MGEDCCKERISSVHEPAAFSDTQIVSDLRFFRFIVLKSFAILRAEV
jgi:hypothetical protein